MDSLKIEMPEGTSTEEVIEKIKELNRDENVHGILLQHPVPSGIDEMACFYSIDLSKEVD